MQIATKILYSFSLISKSRKVKYLCMVAVQVFLPILDLVSILMLGFLAQNLLLSNSGNSTKFSPLIKNEIVRFLGLDDQHYLLFLAITSMLLLIIKGFLSVFINSRTYSSLSKASLEYSALVARKFFSGNLARIQILPSTKIAKGLNDAINWKIVGVLGAFAALVGEIALVVSIGIFLFFQNEILTIGTIIYLLMVFSILQKILGRLTSSLAETQATADEVIRSLIHESINSFRELFVLDAVDDMLENFNAERIKASTSHTKLLWLVSLPKYIFEAVFIAGVVVLLGLVIFFPNLGIDQISVAIFFIAGIRVLPSIIRIQNLFNIIEFADSSSNSVNEIADLELVRNERKFSSMVSAVSVDSLESKLAPTVEIRELSFSYFDNKDFRIEVSELKIECGEQIALVGASGSGKSTFADLLLGVLEPASGQITISDFYPAEAIKLFPGGIGYVPQSSNLFSADIFSNVAIYKSKSVENINRAWDCLEMAQLASFVRKLPDGIDTQIGERGYKLSGGQKQRLSLARALFPNPELLVLDEATSALDSETENSIGQVIQKLNKDTTVVVIAHRLSTINSFQRLLYFENGKIIGDGTFDQLRKNLPQFDAQALLSGF